MDCIRIINLKIPGRHGVYEFEKEKDGLFELDVELFLDLKSAGKSDDLAKTVNYGEAVVMIRIRKPHAPISANFDTVEVELERTN